MKGLKSADALDNLNRDADDVLHRMMDESTAEISKSLHGHSGPVKKYSSNQNIKNNRLVNDVLIVFRFTEYLLVQIDLNYFPVQKMAPYDYGVCKLGHASLLTKAMCFPCGKFDLPVRATISPVADMTKQLACGPPINLIA